MYFKKLPEYTKKNVNNTFFLIRINSYLLYECIIRQIKLAKMFWHEAARLSV
jgi:hypothetical protein